MCKPMVRIRRSMRGIILEPPVFAKDRPGSDRPPVRGLMRVATMNPSAYTPGLDSEAPTMTHREIAQSLQTKFGPKVLAALPDDKHPRVHVEAANWRTIAEFLRRDPALQFDWLANLSGVDYVADDKMCVVYD